MIQKVKPRWHSHRVQCAWILCDFYAQFKNSSSVIGNKGGGRMPQLVTLWCEVL